jgi:ABC-type Zn uptake system ZnuABC Zn-binding protein ZnuA
MLKQMLLAALLGLLAASSGLADQNDDPLKVVASIPDLGDLATLIGGDAVSVSVLAKGSEDAHFVEAKPSFVKLLSQADVYLQVGMDLEVGYAPLLLRNARNGRILPGADGFVDCSVVIQPLDVPQGPIDRSMGDVHPLGSPHYLLDPMNGLRVAALLRDRFGKLRESKQEQFKSRFDAFRTRIGEALVGKALAKKYDVEKLMVLQNSGALLGFLKKQDEDKLLGGWIGALAPFAGTRVVVDHGMWSYFARRFGLVVAGSLEPKPGVQPSTGHLSELIRRMKSDTVKLVLSAPYYDPRHARFVSEQSGAKVLAMAHQVGAREGAGDYLGMLDYDVKQIAASLEGAK